MCVSLRWEWAKGGTPMAVKPVKPAGANAQPANAAQPATLKHAIILVHGAGRYGKWENAPAGSPKYTPDTEGWFKRCSDTLETVCDIARTAIGSKRSFDDRFVVRTINYDKIFEEFRQAWVQQAGKWGDLGKELNVLGLGPDLTDSVRNFLLSGKEDKFGWNNALDVILYLCPTVRSHINASVVRQIGEILAGTEEQPAGLGIDFERWSVICHSLGTAVFHDAYTEYAGALAVTDGRPVRGPDLMCAVSNLSRLLTGSAYSSIMKPGRDPAPATYIECRHNLDFIAHVNRFDPQWDTDTHGLYRPCIGLNEIFVGANLEDFPESPFDALTLPHEFWHYMYQPEVAGAIWGNLLERTTARATIATAVGRAAPGRLDEELRNRVKTEFDKVIAKVGDPNKLSSTKIFQLLTDYFGG
jgi:hypothetical protein